MKVFLALALTLISCSARVPQVEGQSYLPLEVGRRWELQSKKSPTPMSFEVLGKAGEAYRVRWQNPWVGVEFHFSPAGDQVLLEALDMGQGVAPMPPRTVYFDFGAPEGSKWSNSIGNMTVTSRQRTISTPSGRYEKCIEILFTDQKGSPQTWLFAPGVGFVQFGDGDGAFLLASVRSDAESGQASVQSTSRPSGRALVGMDANPTAKEGYGPAATKSRIRLAAESGGNYFHLSQKWSEVETSPGRYAFEEVQLKAGAAAENGLPINFILRTVDTNALALPPAYQDWAFDDPRMAEKLDQLLRKIAPHLRGRVRWVTIGNEADVYFGSHRKQVKPYARLLSRVIPTVRELFPGAQITVNYTFGGLSQIDQDLRPITEQIDFLSLTYYPLNADLTMRDPSVAEREIRQMMNAAGTRKVLFQEIGYASAERLASSPAKQAQFVENVFRALPEYGDRIIAANFLWMSDLPASVVDELTAYYKMGNAENFKAFLGTLGYFDREGKPKPAWSVFQRHLSRSGR